MLTEDCAHGTLICGSDILQSKGHHSVAVHSQWRSEGCVLLVFWIHLDLIVSGESVHERHPLEPTRIINHDIRDWEREFIFGTGCIEITKINASASLPILLWNGDDVGNLVRVLLFSDKPRVN